jgi:hypothetical protein
LDSIMEENQFDFSNNFNKNNYDFDENENENDEIYLLKQRIKQLEEENRRLKNLLANNNNNNNLNSINVDDFMFDDENIFNDNANNNPFNTVDNKNDPDKKFKQEIMEKMSKLLSSPKKGPTNSNSNNKLKNNNLKDNPCNIYKEINNLFKTEQNILFKKLNKNNDLKKVTDLLAACTDNPKATY